MLPDHDKIPSLVCNTGTYRTDRWPQTVDRQIRFLLEVSKRFGGGSSFTLVPSFDGYPGYISVRPQKDIEDEIAEHERLMNARIAGLQKLTDEEKAALGVRKNA